MGPTQKATILIVEDQPGFRRIYHDVLERDGYAVLEGEDGEIGWELVSTQKPDLVILDLVLPKLHGFEVLKKIRADQGTKNIPVIIFSVLGEQEDIQRGLDLGANDYAVKGFYSPREILSKVRALLAKSDIKEYITSYKISMVDDKGDASNLQQDFGLSKQFQCPYCNTPVIVELTPDYARTDGHWFFAHFVCPNCNRGL